MKKYLLFLLVALFSVTAFSQRNASKAKAKTTQQQKSKTSTRSTDWIYGVWEYDGTIDYGPYLGGVKRINCRLVITKSGLKSYTDGQLEYNGSYRVRNGSEIVYDETRNYCTVLPLDHANHRIELGGGKYYKKISNL